MIEYNGKKIEMTEIDSYKCYNLSCKELKSLEDVHGLEGDTEVEYLDLAYNKLTSFSEVISTLPNLKVIYAIDNQISILPESIGNLKSLKFIELRDNNLH